VTLHSIVVPVYGNEGSLTELLCRLAGLSARLEHRLEVVFVVDGSPDRSGEILAESLPGQPFASRLVYHSRNFGSFAAIRTGLAHASGSYVGVMAADLQEPPELMLDFFGTLAADEADVVVGVRTGRGGDPRMSALASSIFWALYRRLVQRDMPVGGIDVFACNRAFCTQLLRLEESHSSLISLTLWLGFRRATVDYERLRREDGESGWTLRKKLRYLSDSVFSFTDLPIRVLLVTGCVGVAVSVSVAIIVGVAKVTGAIDVPGYAATTMLISFFGALNLAGLGILGAYVWRAFENTKSRPGAIVMVDRLFSGQPDETPVAETDGVSEVVPGEASARGRLE
jgi:glycosyltransferase involved in cell wall biosynthesis